MHVWKYKKVDVWKIVSWLKIAQHSFYFSLLCFLLNCNGNGMRWWDAAVGLQQEKCIMTELIRELLWSKPVHTILTISFVESSGTNMFWSMLAKKIWTIRCWLAAGVKFGSDPGRLRFTERQQTGLADSSHWTNKIVLILFIWVF